MEFRGKKPQVSASAFVADGAHLIGDVHVGEKASIWFNAVLRADINSIQIGDESNIQDNCTVHVDHTCPVVVGKRVTVGHNVVIHGATIGDGALLGMGSIILNGARIGAQAIIGAGAVVAEGSEIPPRSLAVGVPAKVIRENLSDTQLEQVAANLDTYVQLAQEYISGE